MNHYQKAIFLLSVATPEQLPPDEGAEVAFIGRSNAGKSSVINALTRNKGLARVSKTPGRTQFINLFTLDVHRRLADLPGYGFARVSDEMKEKWLDNMESYFNSRQCLKGLVLVMDIRHPMQPMDQSILEGSALAELPVHILLNKADKLSKAQILKTENEVKKTVQEISPLISLQTFSALKQHGIEPLCRKLNTWYGY